MLDTHYTKENIKMKLKMFTGNIISNEKTSPEVYVSMGHLVSR